MWLIPQSNGDLLIKLDGWRFYQRLKLSMGKNTTPEERDSRPFYDREIKVEERDGKLFIDDKELGLWDGYRDGLKEVK